MKVFSRIAAALAMAMTLAMFTATTASAQDHGKRQHNKENREKFEQFQKQLEAEKVGFISAQLELTQDEAQIFWPVYNDYCTRRENASRRQMGAYRALAAAIHKGEGDITALAKNYLNAQKECAAINSDLMEFFKGVIPDEKIAKLIVAEESFRREQFRKMSRQGDGRPGPGHNGQGPDERHGGHRGHDHGNAE